MFIVPAIILYHTDPKGLQNVIGRTIKDGRELAESKSESVRGSKRGKPFMRSGARDYHRTLKYEGLVKCGGVVPEVPAFDRSVGPRSAHERSVYSGAVTPAMVMYIL